MNGAIPVTRIADNEQYSGIVTWSPNHPVFAAATQYTATIMLTPKSGYTLHGVSADFFRVDGAVSVRNEVNSGDITAVFPATAATGISSVSIIITAPVKGATPATTADGSGSFTVGSVSWLPPSTSLFLGGTAYTAVVTLTANSGHTFTESISATINGQDATISNNTGSAVTLSHTFPATDTRTVSGIAVTTQPSKLTYTHGEPLNLAGLAVTLTHDDTTTEVIAAADFAGKNITANPAAGNNVVYTTHNGQPVRITYGSLTCNTNNLTVNRLTPTAADFVIGETRTFTYDGSPKTVTIAPKEGKSGGTITVKYNGNSVAPWAAGTYTVTFDVAEAGDFNAASGLSAGTLTIGKANPVAVDFDISGTGTFTYDGSPKTVTVTPQAGKSNGTITVKYNGSTVVPSAVGEYTVTFDVTAGTNFNAVSGLSAGTLTIGKATPTVADFTISGTGSVDYNDSSKTVTITPKAGKSNGTITVYYEGTGSTTYTKSISAPSAIGMYTVTFDVAAATGFNAANGLSAGTLTIIVPTFTSIDALKTYLQGRPANTTATAYSVKLNVSNLGGVGYTLSANGNKYVRLDLSGSTSIGDDAFRDCVNLTSVTIGNSVTSIGDQAFYECKSLTSVTIGNSVTRIGRRAFSNCTSLTSVTFTATSKVTSIGDYAFSRCTNLTSVTIPNSVTSIEYWAFSNCSSLTSITIPNSVTTIGGQAFFGCSGLTEINVDAGNSAYISQDGVLYNKAKTSLIQYPRGKAGAFTIPNSVTSIEDAAFWECASLTGITIPSGVTSIGGQAFYNCAGLTGITIPDSVTHIGWDVFSGCTNLNITWYYNPALTASNFSNYLKNVIILDSVTSIGSNAFAYTGLTSVTIPASVTNIGQYAFDNCRSLTSVTFAGTIASSKFDIYAFNDQGDLRNKFYATDSTNGTPGTYTRPNSSSRVWTKSVKTDPTVTWPTASSIIYGAALSTSTLSGGSGTPAGTFAWTNPLTIPIVNNSGYEVTFTPNDPSNYNTQKKTISILVSYSVTFDSNGGSTVTPYNVSTHGTAITAPTAPTKTRFTLEGWYKEAALTNKWNFSTDTVTNNVTLYAKWIYSGGTPIAYIEDVVPYLATLSTGGSTTSPASLPMQIDLGNIYQAGSGWRQLFDAIDAAGKYVSLDLSACTFFGRFNPNNEVPTGKSRIITIILPNELTSISNENFTFSGFDSLISITIGDWVTTIGSNVFNTNASLSAINVSANNPNYSSVDGVLYNKNSTTLVRWPCGKTPITIPNNITTIGSYAFSGCSGLTGSLTIPAGVTTIEGSAFSGCSGLTGSLTIPNSVTSIGDWAFGGCSGLTGSLTIPNSVTTIGDWAFYRCSGLTSVTIGNSVTYIGNNAFYDCSGLTGSLTIPNSVTSIGDWAFYRCSGLTGSLTIGNSVTTIGDYAFKRCTNLTSVTFTATSKVTSIGNDAFYANRLTSVTIPNSVITIGDYAFNSNPLTNIVFSSPSRVTSIGAGAFICGYDDGTFSNLTSVSIPNSVTFIGRSAFENIHLTTITIGANVNVVDTLDDHSYVSGGYDSPWYRFCWNYYSDYDTAAGKYTRKFDGAYQWTKQ